MSTKFSKYPFGKPDLLDYNIVTGQSELDVDIKNDKTVINVSVDDSFSGNIVYVYLTVDQISKGSELYIDINTPKNITLYVIGDKVFGKMYSLTPQNNTLYYIFNAEKFVLVSEKKNETPIEEAFVIRVDTENGGSASDTMRLPIQGTNMTIDWGDGTVETEVMQTENPDYNLIEHQYNTVGEYEIKITGLVHISFNGWNDHRKLTQVVNWGTIKWQSMKNAFKGCTNLTSIDIINHPNLSNVTDMGSMFQSLPTFNLDISGWDVSNVTNMDGMFAGCDMFNSDLSQWNTQNVTSMEAMFKTCDVFNSDISQWNVGNVTNMNRMFQSATNFNADISGWDVSEVTDMYLMFYKAGAFNSNLSQWNTAKVTNMYGMFSQATNFNSNISQWNTGNVTDMGLMFRLASNFNQDLSGWCVTNIGSLPTLFDDGATAWVLPDSRPIWGECPGS